MLFFVEGLGDAQGKADCATREEGTGKEREKKP